MGYESSGGKRVVTKNGGIAPMTWEECEQHNLKYYEEVFIIPKFNPQTYGEWNELLQKMDPNPFIRAFHLKKADEYRRDTDGASWRSLAHLLGADCEPVRPASARPIFGQ